MLCMRSSCRSCLASPERATSVLQGCGLTHRRGLHEDVLAAQVRAGEGSRHSDNEVEYGDDNGFNRANWREGGKMIVLLGKAWRVGLGTSCNPVAASAGLQEYLRIHMLYASKNIYEKDQQAAPLLEEHFCALKPSVRYLEREGLPNVNR